MRRGAFRFITLLDQPWASCGPGAIGGLLSKQGRTGMSYDSVCTGLGSPGEQACVEDEQVRTSSAEQEVWKALPVKVRVAPGWERLTSPPFACPSSARLPFTSAFTYTSPLHLMTLIAAPLALFIFMYLFFFPASLQQGVNSSGRNARGTQNSNRQQLPRDFRLRWVISFVGFFLFFVFFPS